MRITYIGHSGFFIEWDSCYWLFDYYKGELPVLNPEKELMVFSSHKHGDHFNPVIFDLSKQNTNVRFVLSSDIDLSVKKRIQMGITAELTEKIQSVKPYERYELFNSKNQRIMIQTLKSTDSGVAFLIQYQGKVIYHAGDLNLWVWREETKQYNNDMTAKFRKEMELLKGVEIDVAFAPLDPRQEEDYYRGLEELLSTAKVKYVFPMHFWEKPSVILKFLQERPHTGDTQIMEVHEPGQEWDITI